jgi:hypothetical protein
VRLRAVAAGGLAAIVLAATAGPVTGMGEQQADQVRLHGELALISQGISDNRGIWRIALEGELTGYFYAKVKLIQARWLRALRVCPQPHSPRHPLSA